MKVLLGIAILVVCVQLVTSTPLNRTKRYAEKPDMSKINELRRAVANYMPKGVSMPDLEWDENLVATAKNLPSDCNVIATGPNFRVFMDGPDQNGAKLVELFYVVFLALDNLDNIALTVEQRKQAMAMKTQLEKEVDRISLQHLELFNPSQTKIGCAQSHCTGVIEAWLKEVLGDQLVGNTYSFDVMCVLGPSKTWPTEDLQKVEYAAGKAQVAGQKSLMGSSPALATALNFALVLVISMILSLH